jgi:hypothetical protein
MTQDTIMPKGIGSHSHDSSQQRVPGFLAIYTRLISKRGIVIKIKKISRGKNNWGAQYSLTFTHSALVHLLQWLYELVLFVLVYDLNLSMTFFIVGARDVQCQCKYWKTVTDLASVSPLEHWLHWHRFHRHSVFLSVRLTDRNTECR